MDLLCQFLKRSYGIIFIFLYVLIYNLPFFNRFYVISEGWYTSLVYFINSGEVLYRDIHWVLPPVYVYIIKFFVDIFGYSIISLRILGLFVVFGIGCFLYLVMRFFFTRLGSLVGVLSVLSCFESMIAFLGYDYYPVFLLFSLISCFLIMKAFFYLATNNQCTYFLLVFCGGCFSTLAIFTRQNSGFFCMVLLFLGLFIVLYKNNSVLRTIILATPYCLGVIFVCSIIACSLIYNNSLMAFVQQAIFQAPAGKGGIAVALFQWFSYVNYYDAAIYGIRILGVLAGLKIMKVISYYRLLDKVCKIIIASPLFLQVKYFSTKVFFSLPLEDHRVYWDRVNRNRVHYFFNKTPSILLYCLPLLCICFIYLGFFTDVSPHRPIYNENKLMYFMVVFNIIFIFFLYNKLSVDKKNYQNSLLFIYSLYSFGLIWGAGSSGGISCFGSIGVLTLFFAFMCHYIEINFNKYFIIITIVILVVIPSGYYSHMKSKQLYSWWMLDSGPLKEAKYTFEHPLLWGLYTTKKNKVNINSILECIEKNTKSDDKIFTFPQIPIFYVLAQRNRPQTNALVHWFDACHDSWIDNDIEILRKSPPKMFIIDNMDKAIYEGHEIAFRGGKKSAQRRMLRAIHDIIADKQYIRVGRMFFSSEHTIELWMRPGTELVI